MREVRARGAGQALAQALLTEARRVQHPRQAGRGLPDDVVGRLRDRLVLDVSDSLGDLLEPVTATAFPNLCRSLLELAC